MLYEYGGLYADCDIECLKPLEAGLTTNCVLNLEPDIHPLVVASYGKKHIVSNALMACEVRHPFFQYVIQGLTKPERFHHRNVLYSTGPIMLDDVYLEFNKSFTNPPQLVPSEIFQPIPDPRFFKQYRQYCKKLAHQNYTTREDSVLANKTCYPYLNNVQIKATNESLTVHKWVHSWIKDSFYQRSKRKTFNVSDLLHDPE